MMRSRKIKEKLKEYAANTQNKGYTTLNGTKYLKNNPPKKKKIGFSTFC